MKQSPHIEVVGTACWCIIHARKVSPCIKVAALVWSTWGIVKLGEESTILRHIHLSCLRFHLCRQRGSMALAGEQPAGSLSDKRPPMDRLVGRRRSGGGMAVQRREPLIISKLFERPPDRPMHQLPDWQTD